MLAKTNRENDIELPHPSLQVRLFVGGTGTSIDVSDARAFSHKSADVDVYVIGFGPNDRSNVVKGTGPLEAMALRKGAEQTGRRGRGAIYVYPSGNGGRYKDSCAFDGKANSIHTLSINAVGESGSMPKYTENCTAVIASAYSSGQYPEGYMVTLKPGGECTNAFTGTSSSSAVAGGVMALLLQANPRLGWRDVQHIVVRGVRPHTELTPAADWRRNAAGRWYSTAFGYGLMDVLAMVQLARRWRNVGPQRTCRRRSSTSEDDTVVNHGEVFRTSLDVDDDGCDGVRFLEHVRVTFSAASVRKRGDVALWLVSPSGTRTHVLPSRAGDYSLEGFRDWTVLTMELWGETAGGRWELQVANVGRPESRLTRPFRFEGWTLDLHGTEDEPPTA